jgi:phage tail sheath protein FI
MAANYLHGVETIEVNQGPRPVQLVKTAVIGIVGMAAAGPVNTPVLVSNETDFAQFGPNIEGSTIRYSLDIIYKQKPTVCIVLNVLDPTRHKTTVSSASISLGTDGSFVIPKQALSGVVIKSENGLTTYAVGTDYTLDVNTGIGQRVSGGSIPAVTTNASVTLKVDYTYIDPSKVTAADVIGSIDLAGHRLGMKAFKDSYALFGFFPKILIAPEFSSLASVSTELAAVANEIRAISFSDAPVGITPQQAITGRGPQGVINFNISSERVGLCYPHIKAYDPREGQDALFPLSVFVAGAQSKKDQEQGYWYSLSNTELLGATGLERPIYAMINDPNSEANLLNGAGIITVFNSFGTGLRTWGNRSAAFPSSTAPTNFICVRRVADIIAESLEYFTLQFMDGPLNNALIDAVVESGNGFMRKLQADGAVIDGKVWFSQALNSAAELAAGHLVISYDFMPPTPGERVTYQSAINTNYLRQLGAQA